MLLLGRYFLPKGVAFYHPDDDNINVFLKSIARTHFFLAITCEYGHPELFSLCVHQDILLRVKGRKIGLIDYIVKKFLIVIIGGWVIIVVSGFQ